MSNRIEIHWRVHPRRPVEVLVDGTSIASFLSITNAERWVAEHGDVELLRTDLAAHFEAQGIDHENIDVQIAGICWQCPDAWVQAAAWFVEADPTACAATITNKVVKTSEAL